MGILLDLYRIVCDYNDKIYEVIEKLPYDNELRKEYNNIREDININLKGDWRTRIFTDINVKVDEKTLSKIIFEIDRIMKKIENYEINVTKYDRKILIKQIRLYVEQYKEFNKNIKAIIDLLGNKKMGVVNESKRLEIIREKEYTYDYLLLLKNFIKENDIIYEYIKDLKPIEFYFDGEIKEIYIYCEGFLERQKVKIIMNHNYNFTVEYGKSFFQVEPEKLEHILTIKSKRKFLDEITNRNKELISINNKLEDLKNILIIKKGMKKL